MKINYFTLERRLFYVLLLVFLSYTLPAQVPWIDINPGSGDGSPVAPYIVGSTIYFNAVSPTLGQEPYKVTCEGGIDTDPSDNVTDIFTGAGSSAPTDFTSWNGGVYFIAFSNDFRLEVFNYEADCSITGMPFNNTSFAGTFNISSLTPSSSFLFLLDIDDLKRIDAMGNVTNVVDAGGSPIGMASTLLHYYNSDIFFNNNNGSGPELMQISDPSAGVATLVLDNIGESIMNVGSFTESGGNLYFIGDSPTSGTGVLYCYDGTNPPFVVMNGGSPLVAVVGELTDAGGILYAFDSSDNLYAVNGAGTVTPINVSGTGTSCDGSSSMNAPSGILSSYHFNGTLYLITDTGIYFINASNEIQVLIDGLTSISRITAVAGDTFYFVADSGPDLLLWSTDGMSCPSPVMQDGTVTDPTEIVAIPGTNDVFFVANSSTYGIELFKSSPSKILAVEFIAFNAFPIDASVKLKWSTAVEVDNAGFEVERSENAVDWEYVGFVKGSGTSNEIQEYDFEDTNPFEGTSYYRLKQLDYGGAFAYSSIESVLLNDKDVEVQSWPNPTQNALHYRIDTEDKDELYKAALYNLTGTQLYAATIEAAEENTIDVSHLPAGNYFLRVNSGSQQYVQRIVKL